jgi:formyl-CoA transferase
MIVEKDWYKAPASPIKLSRTPAQLRSLPPKFGQHSAEVLAEFGFAEAEISDLMQRGIVPAVRQQ